MIFTVSYAAENAVAGILSLYTGRF